MKNLRYFLLMLLLAPGFALAQSTSDSIRVVAGDVNVIGHGAAFGTPFQEDVNIGPLPLVEAEPFDACEPITNPGDVEGNIVLITRGACAFVLKTQHASEAGAAGVIIMNNDADGDAIVLMGGACEPSVCTVPALSVTRNQGEDLQIEAQFGADATLIPVAIQPTPPPSTAGVHSTGVMTLSVYDYGFLGANANFAHEGGGVPFAFNDIEGGLFVSSVLIGQDGVVNTNPYTQLPPEFENVTDVTTITPPAPFDEAFETSYSSEELGVLVTQRSYSRNGDPFVIVELEIENTTGSDLNGVHVGLFADWDVVDPDDPDGTSTDDLGGVNEDLNLVYVYDAGMAQYYGVLARGEGVNLSGSSVDATSADDAELWEALTSAVTPGGDPAERAGVTGIGPLSIAAGTSTTVEFAYVAGASESDLFSNAQVALEPLSTEQTTPEGTYVLESAYPNPFSARTTIGFELPTAQDVRLVVYDVLGREVAVLVEGVRQAGPQTVEFDASSLPSGMYIYRLEAGSVQLMERVTLVR